MKITKAEKVAIAVTLLFLVFVAGVHIGTSDSRDTYTISTQKETKPVAEPQETAAEKAHAREDSLININTATEEELMRLKGVGEKLAQRIIEYRDRAGSFGKPQDITKVSGIGSKIYEDNKDQITVD